MWTVTFTLHVIKLKISYMTHIITFSINIIYQVLHYIKYIILKVKKMILVQAADLSANELTVQIRQTHKTLYACKTQNHPVITPEWDLWTRLSDFSQNNTTNVFHRKPQINDMEAVCLTDVF